MISAVRSALKSIVSSNVALKRAKGAGRLFELFIATGVAIELRNMGLNVWLQRSDGTRILPTHAAKRFIQRGGAPAGVFPASAGGGNPSVIGFNAVTGGRWEIWNGVQFRGRSGASHEIDIAVVPFEVGRALRAKPSIELPFGRPRVSIECKDVGTAGGPDEMRAFVARLYDTTILTSHSSHFGQPSPSQCIYPGSLPAHSVHRPSFTYWRENRRTLNVLARRAGFATGATALTTYYSVEPHGGITPTSTHATTLMKDVANWIFARCR